MKITKKSFVMNNLACYEKKLKKNKWWKGLSIVQNCVCDDCLKYKIILLYN